MNKDSAINKVLTALKKSPSGCGVELLSYKRNRGIAIVREDGGQFWVRERGYEEQELIVGMEELGRVLKTMVKREFPRSRKLRVYQIRSPEDLAKVRKKL